jgi:hypothetical protein
MAKLPFVVEPRLKPIIEEIGSDESGKIKIERRGYLTSGEKAFYQQVKQSDAGTNRMISLARKVSRFSKVELSEGYDAIIRVISGNSKSDLDVKIEEEFVDEIATVIQELTSGQTNDELLMAACLVKYRIDSNFAMDEIMKLHPDIVAGLASLYREEEAKSIERLTGDKETDKNESIEKIAKKSNQKVEPKI